MTLQTRSEAELAHMDHTKTGVSMSSVQSSRNDSANAFIGLKKDTDHKPSSVKDEPRSLESHMFTGAGDRGGRKHHGASEAETMPQIEEARRVKTAES